MNTDKIIDLHNAATFGVAGNFTGHLEQAGEAKDFLQIKTKDAKAPKAIFPTFIPENKSSLSQNNKTVPFFLHTFPFDDEKIIFPKGEEKIQIEPECAVVFKAAYSKNKVTSLTPIEFGASNDCSIRKEGAKKISQKKNWCKASKGFSSHRIKLDSFTKGTVLDTYRIASFLIRDGKAFIYGEDSAVRDYSYIYEKLTEWMIDRLNNQMDEGPQENISTYLNEAQNPEHIMISIGATRYTDFGEHNFLQDKDISVVVLYPENKYTLETIKEKAEKQDFSDEDISWLYQTVVL